MGQFNYDRIYSLNISTPPTALAPPTVDIDLFDQTFTVPLVTSEPVNYLAEYDSITVDDLQMTADISSSSDIKGANSDTINIKVFNLNEQTRNKIAVENNFVILKAGYRHQQDDLPVIFVGQIATHSTKTQGPDSVTTLFCKGGHIPSSSIRVNLKIPSNPPPLNTVTYGDVFERLFQIWKENGLAVTNESVVIDELLPPLNKSPKDTFVNGSYIFTGKLTEAMDQICEGFNLIWYLQKNVVYVHSVRYKKANTLININSSQIKEIEKGGQSLRQGSTGQSSKGVIITTFLNGRITAGNILRVDDEFHGGDYIIKSITHKLDYRGSNWSTKLVCEVKDD